MNEAASRRFSASASRLRHPGRWILGSLLMMYGIMLAIQLLLPVNVSKAIGPAPLFVFVLGYLAFMGVMFTPRPVGLVVSGRRLALGDGAKETFPLDTATLGSWRTPYYGTSSGTVLHLVEGARRLRLGGQDHRPLPDLRLDAPPVESVDAHLSAADFDELLSFLPALHADAPRVQVSRCLLIPNRATGWASLSMMAPWLGTIVLCILVGTAANALDLDRSPAGQVAVSAAIGLLVVSGMGLTVVRSMRTPTPTLALDVTEREVSLIDLRTSATLAQAPIGALSLGRGVHGAGGRTTLEIAVLALGFAGREPLTIGVPDLRFSWVDQPGKVPAGKYVVSAADFLLLTGRVGVGSLLKTTAT